MYGRTYDTQFFDECLQIAYHIRNRKIREFEISAVDTDCAGNNRYHRTVLSAHPALGQPQGEYQHVAGAEHFSYCAEMSNSVFVNRLRARKTLMLNLWAERVQIVPVPILPVHRRRHKKAVGPLEELQKLANRVDVPELGRKHAEIFVFCCHSQRRLLRNEILKTGFRLRSQDKLSETTANGGNAKCFHNTKTWHCDRID